jgi:hypothetical protein
MWALGELCQPTLNNMLNNVSPAYASHGAIFAALTPRNRLTWRRDAGLGALRFHGARLGRAVHELHEGDNLEPGSLELARLERAVISKGNDILWWLRTLEADTRQGEDDGGLEPGEDPAPWGSHAEPIDRTRGKAASVQNLTWSEASIVDAIHARAEIRLPPPPAN